MPKAAGPVGYQHEGVGGGSSPCLLASHLQCLNIEERKRSTCFFPSLPFLIPTLKE